MADASNQPAESVKSSVDTHMLKGGRVANEDWRSMAKPEVDGIFIRPHNAPNAQPVWGFRKGLQIGLYPLSGPRGLLRIYLPELGLPEARSEINFIAIEPVVKGQIDRGYSEMENSPLDNNEPGLRFWSTDTIDDTTPRLPEDCPARGTLSKDGAVDILAVYIQIEDFANGAKVAVRISFRSDRPQEVGVATFKRPGCADLELCVVSSTMGTYARLRQLHLKDSIVYSGDLWPEFTGNHFAEHKFFALDMLPRVPTGDVLIGATSDEKDPQMITEGFPDEYWIYRCRATTHYWRIEEPRAELKVQVNGRLTYYESNTQIPGGIAYENFEMVEPYYDGAEYWFGVTTKLPAELVRCASPAILAPRAEPA